MSNANQVNYIIHLENCMEQMHEDSRLGPWHISLYIALFYCWNQSKFKKEISINRSELMEFSRIGSVNTYTKTIKDLHNWSYLKYVPSKNRFRGSKVIMYRFDNTSNKTERKETVKQPRPSLNSKNKSNKKQNETKDTPPVLNEVEAYFKSQKSTETEAIRFFNYYESNGWKVGGKTKMKDWKAASRNWILRSAEYQKNRNTSSGRLNVNESKDYDIPL